MEFDRLERFTEFLVIGVMLGLVEDIIAIQLATDTEFSMKIIPVLLIVAIPFAAFSELVVDSKNFDFPEKFIEFIREKI